jgi:hypothetical protein
LHQGQCRDLHRDHEETLRFVEFDKTADELVFTVFTALAVFFMQTPLLGPLFHE